MSDRHTLRWSYPSTPSPPTPLPKHISRQLIPTPSGTLELLSAQPPPSPSTLRKQALLFQHGGFGCAAVWIEYLTYFSQQHGYPCYALSLRGHGASWKPAYWSYVWGTGLRSLAFDLRAGINFVKAIETEKRAEVLRDDDLVLIAHSAGGGLSQHLLDQGMAKVGGLVLIAAFPNFGGWGVYWNWVKNDPWFAIRYYVRDLWHSRSPLSSTTLVHKAFFAPNFPVSKVREFEKLLPEYESMIWPLSMMLTFVNVEKVVRSVLGWERGGERMLIVAGTEDRLMGTELMRRMAAEYRAALGGEGASSVGFEIVEGAGHHLQNDTPWEDGAEKILNFLKQL